MALAATLALMAGAAEAHHGWTAYSEQEGEVSGVVEAAELGAPHGLIKVRSADGVWDVMLAPPAAIQRAGLTLAAVPKGAKVTARGHKRSDGSREIKTERLVVGGKTFDLYPARD
ncbi:MAG: hypothetical protein DI570_00320 [Phenylobacterium zucineum]|nr:MAG: hypothetical protein DI570_00320 [Phenylobacterium zucineum]